MKKINNNFSEPSEKKLNTLLSYCQNGRYLDAEKLSLSITQKFPQHKFAWKVLAAMLNQNGKINESLIVSKKCVQLDPQDAEAHKNLGVILQAQGLLKEAEESLKKAISLEPNYIEAYGNLGILFQSVEKYKEAELCYKKVIKLKPNDPIAYNNLGTLLVRQRKLDEAFSAFIQAITLNPNFTNSYSNLSIIISKVRFKSSNVKLYPILDRLISSGNFVRPVDLAPSILSLLNHDPIIKNLVQEKNLAINLKELDSIIIQLHKVPILHNLMRICPLTDLKFEQLFTNLRSLILKNINSIESSPELIHFLSTLSLNCFANEYIYREKYEDTKLIEKIEAEIKKIISKSKHPEIIKILCLASYRPLHKYDWCKKIKNLDLLQDVKTRLIEEPYAEREIMKKIPILGIISDKVSQKVRGQYEENPYPRWIKTGLHIKKKSISEVCAESNIRLHSQSIKKVIKPNILVAGCGTGQHSIGMSSQFSKCKITAVDLSLASLAYAKRKTTELGINNIKYFQADILNLNKLEQKFDIVDSVGVLHHMHEPTTGWRILVDLLKPGGLMRIGLYSELARQHIMKVRTEIKLLKIGTSENEIRKFRYSLLKSNDADHKQLTKVNDFYSLSMLRDLIFHTSEHCFTLLQIKKNLDSLGLKFCGFINKDIIFYFKNFHGKDANIYDLELWNKFEENYTKAFSSMYQFWCQKI